MENPNSKTQNTEFEMKIHVCVSVVFVTLTLGQLTNGDIDQRMADLEHLVLTLVRERDQSNSRLQEVESSTRQQLVSLDRKLVSVKSELSDLQYKYDNLIVQKTDVLQTSVPKSGTEFSRSFCRYW